VITTGLAVVIGAEATLAVNVHASPIVARVALLRDGEAPG
jgi:hypothetical protein